MQIVKIKLDYLHGPIWKDNVDLNSGKYSTGIRVIDEDMLLLKLNEEAQNLYSSFYQFEQEDKAVSFQMDKEQRDRVLTIIEKIKNRLEEINDGSYVVEDDETERLRAALLKSSDVKQD